VATGDALSSVVIYFWARGSLENGASLLFCSFFFVLCLFFMGWANSKVVLCSSSLIEQGVRVVSPPILTFASWVPFGDTPFGNGKEGPP